MCRFVVNECDVEDNLFVTRSSDKIKYTKQRQRVKVDIFGLST